mmetsp:Transcript_140364/g.448635  ORF Transcript_140364/g.448635 Transcript_140364/m.448635 type:complete len:494 (-) Transcript_140364:77-1558(-)|eukprot:CAMPEP_0203945628 /NCGR_PEP_ID=MMETSP0359-20131031/81097_1 /ASSEMBLY_ACC=CAM_ASM_000338 /TAXON_ID=268821 /ORGANISM="Scrippsiella Hangoei, Strain SHTV-5" /LENGTH=493 /DNA_ID=CAMNT_0050876813 /DNA_START=94 /DNA_END=1575 /DNA_ORIENTATION=-
MAKFIEQRHRVTLLLLLAASAACVGSIEFESSSVGVGELARDDECSSSDPAECTFNALQRRGAAVREHAAAAAAAAGTAEEGASAKAAGARRTDAQHRWDPSPDEPLKILFVGNSFTYGPPEHSSDGQQQPLHNLPRMLKFIAESMGHQVVQEEDTLGACTLHAHRPSQNPEACTDPAFCQPIELIRVNRSLECTGPAAITKLASNSSFCPQRLLRSDYGTWDVIVLQDHSNLPTIEAARRTMYYPAIREYAAAAKRLKAKARKRKTLIALYMTWSYYDGGIPLNRGLTGCWPMPMKHLAYISPGRYGPTVRDQACQAYSLASGAASGLRFGGDVLVPAGLAWQVARGSPAIPGECKRTIDEQYGGYPQLSALKLPLRASNESAVRWRGKDGMKLYRDKGPKYKSPYCEDCAIDLHASAAGMYLNALVFYATLFKRSPLGVAVPDGVTVVDGLVLPKVSLEDAEALQQIAHDVVMGNMDTWWKGDQQPMDQQP